MGSGYGLGCDMAVSCIFWSLMQCVLMIYPDLTVYKIERKTYLDLRNRMVSFVHGLVALVLSAISMYMVGQSCGEANTNLEYLILANSGGYFLYDVLGMWWFGLLEFDMGIHHALCIGGIIVVLLGGHNSSNVVAGLFVAEVSNPAMHVRVMLRNIGKRYTKAYEAAEYTYFVMYIFGRVLIGHPVVWKTVTCESMNLLAKIVSLGVLAQSY